MLTESTATELRKLEAMLLDPEVRRDRAQVSALLAEDFVEFGSSGRVWTKQTTIELLATEGESYVRPILEDFESRELAEGVVLITYRAVKTSDPATGGSVALRSSIWTKESGQWRLRFHQGTRVS
jgi:hypothetical protein